MSEKRLMLLKSIRTNLYMVKALSKTNKDLAERYLTNVKKDSILYMEFLNEWNKDKTLTLIKRG